MVLFLPSDSKTLAAGVERVDRWFKEDDGLVLWDLSRKNSSHRQFQISGIHSVSFSPDGKKLLCGIHRESVLLIDPVTGKDLRPFKSHRGKVFAVAYSPTGDMLATGSADRIIRLWDARTGKVLRKLAKHKEQVDTVAFSPDGHRLASGGRDGVILWDVHSGKALFGLDKSGGRVVAFSPDGKILAVGGRGYVLRFWDPHTGKEVRNFADTPVTTSCMSLSPDGRILACVGDGSVRLHDVATGKTLHGWKTQPGVTGIAFSPDGCTLAVASEAGFAKNERNTIQLWETLTGQVRANFPGFINESGSVAFSPDGRLLATGGNAFAWDMNRVIRVYDLASSKELPGFRGHLGHVRAVAFSPDGSSLATASDDATALVWDVPPHGESAVPRPR